MWKMIFHFFLLLFVLICVLLKTICSILIEHAMKNKYYGKRGRKPHSHKWCCCHGRLSRHAVLVWCKNTAKDSHFCIKPHAKDEETARADDKADIHKMIFWRARERKKRNMKWNMMEMVLFINQILCTQIHYSAKVVSFKWKYFDIGNFRMQNMNDEFQILAFNVGKNCHKNRWLHIFFTSRRRKSFYIESRFVFPHFLSIYWIFLQIEWE